MRRGVKLDLSKLPGLNLPEPQAEKVRAAASPAPRRKPAAFKLKAPKQKERPQQAAIHSHLSKVVRNGFSLHIQNEGFWSFIDDPAVRGRLKNAAVKDGFREGAPDELTMWPLPDDWRAALEAHGIKVPKRLACAVLFEVKRPGWKPDKAWRESAQAKLHDWLLSIGIPVAIVRDVFEVDAAAAEMGVPLRYRITPGASGAMFRTPAEEGDDEPT